MDSEHAEVQTAGGTAVIPRSDPPWPWGAQERQRAGRQPEPAGHYHSTKTRRHYTNPKADIPTAPLSFGFVFCYLLLFSDYFPLLPVSPVHPHCLTLFNFQIFPICVSNMSASLVFGSFIRDQLQMLAALCINVSSNNYKCMYVNEFTDPCRTITATLLSESRKFWVILCKTTQIFFFLRLY